MSEFDKDFDPESIKNQQQQELLSRLSGFGGKGSTSFSTMNGFNTQGGLPNLPPNTDNQGLTFFTKPCLNLSYHNVRNIRTMTFLMDRTPLGMGNAIRCMLSPYGMEPSSRFAPEEVDPEDGRFIAGDEVRSAIIDDNNGFIPLLTNTLLSLSGWPDTAPTTHTSTAGPTGEQVGWIDNPLDNRSSYQLTANFANIQGNPVMYLFKTWIDYACAVCEGSMVPYPIHIMENRIDYQTRIYRLVLDNTRTYVQRIAACGAGFPSAVPDGANLNFEKGTPFNTENNQISLPFTCFGVIKDDPILRYEFNTVTLLANPDMAPEAPAGMVARSSMVKLDSVDSPVPDGVVAKVHNERKAFSHKAYPWISDTWELEWWTPKTVYNEFYNTLGELQ